MSEGIRAVGASDQNGDSVWKRREGEKREAEPKFPSFRTPASKAG